MAISNPGPGHSGTAGSLNSVPASKKATLSSNGNFQVDGTLTADATATLLIKNSSGSTLKTINGFATN